MASVRGVHDEDGSGGEPPDPSAKRADAEEPSGAALQPKAGPDAARGSEAAQPDLLQLEALLARRQAVLEGRLERARELRARMREAESAAGLRQADLRSAASSLQAATRASWAVLEAQQRRVAQAEAALAALRSKAQQRAASAAAAAEDTGKAAHEAQSARQAADRAGQRAAELREELARLEAELQAATGRAEREAGSAAEPAEEQATLRRQTDQLREAAQSLAQRRRGLAAARQATDTALQQLQQQSSGSDSRGEVLQRVLDKLHTQLADAQLPAAGERMQLSRARIARAKREREAARLQHAAAVAQLQGQVEQLHLQLQEALDARERGKRAGQQRPPLAQLRGRAAAAEAEASRRGDHLAQVGRELEEAVAASMEEAAGSFRTRQRLASRLLSLPMVAHDAGHPLTLSDSDALRHLQGKERHAKEAARAAAAELDAEEARLRDAMSPQQRARERQLAAQARAAQRQLATGRTGEAEAALQAAQAELSELLHEAAPSRERAARRTGLQAAVRRQRRALTAATHGHAAALLKQQLLEAEARLRRAAPAAQRKLQEAREAAQQATLRCASERQLEEAAFRQQEAALSQQAAQRRRELSDAEAQTEARLQQQAQAAAERENLLRRRAEGAEAAAAQAADWRATEARLRRQLAQLQARAAAADGAQAAAPARTARESALAQRADELREQLLRLRRAAAGEAGAAQRRLAELEAQLRRRTSEAAASEAEAQAARNQAEAMSLQKEEKAARFAELQRRADELAEGLKQLDDREQKIEALEAQLRAKRAASSGSDAGRAGPRSAAAEAFLAASGERSPKRSSAGDGGTSAPQMVAVGVVPGAGTTMGAARAAAGGAGRAAGTPAAAPAAPSLSLVAAAASRPHPDKAAAGGEDAWMISAEGRGAIGVADGAGGTAEEGADSAAYARALMLAAERSFAEPPSSPAAVLRQAHARVAIPGGSTAILAALQSDNVLEVVNLGDSGLRLVRAGRVAFRTAAQEHSFNMPFQLACPALLPTADGPSDAQVHSVKVQAGDVLVMATDGLMDNMWDDQLLRLLAAHQKQSPSQRAALQCASQLADAAGRNMENAAFRSPWAENAARAGRGGIMDWLFPRGGRLDDCTVIVAFVVAQDAT